MSVFTLDRRKEVKFMQIERVESINAPGPFWDGVVGGIKYSYNVVTTIAGWLGHLL